MLDSIFGPYKKYATLVLRIGLAIVFIAHGWGKVTGIEGTAGFFAKVGIPLSSFFAYVVAAVEFGGGILILLGLFTRIAAALIAIVMVVAIFTVKLSQGFLGGYELDFILLCVAIALMLTGSGPVALGSSVEEAV
jgi:uncharacterized membrane protein YphA (DoxX/SURF4 family)